MAARNNSGHILLLCIPAWGHLRPLIGLACKIAKERPDMVVTLPTMGAFGERTEKEISRFIPGNGTSRSNIRVIGLGGQGSDPFELLPMLHREFSELYQEIVDLKPIRCRVTGKVYDAVPKPNAAVIDFFLYNVFNVIRSVTDRSVPIFVWATGNTSAMLRLFGPEELGGYGDVAEKARKEREATGRNLEEIEYEESIIFTPLIRMFRPAGGNLIKVPGLPLMYDYELYPQDNMPSLPINELLKGAYLALAQCDGVIAMSAAAYEQVSIEASRTWLLQTNRHYYAIGPLLPPGIGGPGLSESAKQTEVDLSDRGGEFQGFLDETLAQHGVHSLVYVSFGSVMWPRNEYVWVLADTLLELGIPFILSHASPKAKVPPGFSEKVKQSGLGIMSTWAPQQTILNHPATGWFVTHCGHNSVTEALAQGIPMIAWPVAGDQPANAASLTLNLDAAFELIEVRTEHGLKPLYRGVTPTGTIEAMKTEFRDVLSRARGEEGARKRENVGVLKEKLRQAWTEGGEALKNLHQFLAALSL